MPAIQFYEMGARALLEVQLLMVPWCIRWLDLVFLQLADGGSRETGAMRLLGRSDAVQYDEIISKEMQA